MTKDSSPSLRGALLGGTALTLLLLGGVAMAFDGHGHIAPPVLTPPPPQPPSIYIPPKLPDSQAIPSRKTQPSAPSTAAPKAAPQPAAKSAEQIAREKAAAEAAQRDRETKMSLQEWLTELGYNPGGIDGVVGPKTMDAVFTWIADIADPERREEARIAAHDGDYEALADMLYIQMINPDAHGGSVAEQPAPAAPAQPAPAPQTAQPQQAAPQPPDATVGMTADPAPAPPPAADSPAPEPEPDVAAAPQPPAAEPEPETLAEDTPPPPPPYVWAGELESAARDVAAFMLGEISFEVPVKPSQFGPPTTKVLVKQPYWPNYDLTRWQTHTDLIHGVAEDSAQRLRVLIGEKNQEMEDARRQIAREEAIIEEMKGIAQSRVADSVATWTERVRDTRSFIAEIEQRTNKRASEMLYESLASSERALANAAENTANSYVHFEEYRNAKKRLDVLLEDLEQIKLQIPVMEWHLAKLEDAGVIMQAYARSVAAAEAGETFDDAAVEAILTADLERQGAVDQAQQDMDTFLRNRMQADAELASLNARTDLSAEQKAQIAEGIEARQKFNDTLLRETQAKLAAEGATFDGFDGTEGLEFDPYALTQTDLELTRIAEEQKATDRFYDELRQARETIRDTAEGLDAIELQDRVTELSERVVENAEQINQLADDLDKYTQGIRVTREQGELEYLAAMAEDAVVAAEENLAYTESVYKTARNAEVALLLIAAGGAATGLGGLTAAEAAAAQGVMAGFEGTTGAIEGYDQGGVVEGLKKGGLEAGKYYLPINTVMAVERGDDTTGVALGVLSDAAILFTGYKAARANLDKAQAAQAAVTRQALSPAEQAVAEAAKRAADKGDDLIATYQQAKWNAQQARAAGVADDVAETTLQQAVKAIDRSDEAKLALKARDAKLQYQFVQDQAAIVKTPAQAAFERNMRAMGWSEEAIQTAQIRNASSAGTVGLDDDIRLLEPSILDKLDDGTPRYSGANDPRLAADKAAFKAQLSRNGEAASLTQWEADAAAAMDDAYRETVGYSAREARVNMTTSTNLEAYADVELLTGQGGSAGWAEQTAAVTRTKIAEGIEAAEAMGLGGGANRLSGVALEKAATETKVAARELLKDLAGKAMRARPDVALPDKVQKQLRILDGLSRGIHDPAVANRLLVEQTGTTLAKTMESLGGQVEVLLKF